MTLKSGLARDMEIVNRWRILAEQRLDHLNELFESGRWRRYHTEQAFEDNVRDAKRAVEAWRMLAQPDGGMAPDLILTSRTESIEVDVTPVKPAQPSQPGRATLLPAEPIMAMPKPQVAEPVISMASASLLPQATQGER